MDVAEYVEIETTYRAEELRDCRGADTSGAGAVGGHAFVAPAGHSLLNNPLQYGHEDFVIYHKKFTGLQTPFDLPIECFPDFEKMLDEDPTCVEVVNVMMRGAVATSTASNYKSVVNKFHCYCMERGHAFPHFDAGAVLRFVKDCFAEGAKLPYFQKIIPALTMLENVLGKENSAISGVVKQSVSAIKRELAQTRGIVKKATGYSYEVIRTLVVREIEPHKEELHKIDAEHFRSIFRGTIIYCTL